MEVREVEFIRKDLHEKRIAELESENAQLNKNRDDTLKAHEVLAREYRELDAANAALREAAREWEQFYVVEDTAPCHVDEYMERAIDQPEEEGT